MKEQANNLKEKLKTKLDLLYQELLSAEVNNNLTKELFFVYDNFKEYNMVFNYTIHAYQSSTILALFKIYDIDQHNESITLKHILNSIFSKKEINDNNNEMKKYVDEKLKELNSSQINEKLNIMRNKYYAHLDKKYEKGMQSFSKEEMITFQEVNDLINNAKKIIKDIYFYIYGLKYNDNNLIETIKIQIDSIIDNMNKGRNII